MPSHTRVNLALRRYDLFDFILLSHLRGWRKPEQQAYRTARIRLEDYGEISKCVYVDDVENNLEPAREEGMLPLHFRNSKDSVQQFKTDLEALLEIPL